jgi:hypothetical protein
MAEAMTPVLQILAIFVIVGVLAVLLILGLGLWGP